MLVSSQVFGGHVWLGSGVCASLSDPHDLTEAQRWVTLALRRLPQLPRPARGGQSDRPVLHVARCALNEPHVVCVYLMKRSSASWERFLECFSQEWSRRTGSTNNTNQVPSDFITKTHSKAQNVLFFITF